MHSVRLRPDRATWIGQQTNRESFDLFCFNLNIFGPTTKLGWSHCCNLTCVDCNCNPFPSLTWGVIVCFKKAIVRAFFLFQLFCKGKCCPQKPRSINNTQPGLQITLNNGRCTHIQTSSHTLSSGLYNVMRDKMLRKSCMKRDCCKLRAQDFFVAKKYNF